MAKTGSITITQNSQSIANNTSNITVVGYVTTSGESWRGNERTGTYTIKQGSTVIKSGSFTHGAPANSKTQMFSVNLTVTHDSNGNSGTISASFNYDNGWCTGSASKTLSRIYRQSVFGTVTGSTLGSSITVNITRYNSAYTHTLWYSFGSKTWQSIGTGIGTSKAFTPALSLASEIPNAASGKMTLILRTFNGSTQIGSDVKKEITVSVPNTSDTKPTLSFTVSDANGYAKSSTTYLNGMSAIKTAITSSGQYGASIKTIATTVNGSTYYTNPAISSIINKTGSISVSVKVTDSRGYSTTSSQSVEFISYIAPIISSLKTVRCDASGTENGSGDYIKVIFSASIHNITGNTAKYVLGYKKASDSKFTTHADTTKYDGSFSVTNGTWIFEADAVPYIVSLDAVDAFKNTTKTIGGSAIYKLFSICKAGLGLAFGKVAEFENTLEVDFFGRFNKVVSFFDQIVEKRGHYVHSTSGAQGDTGYMRLCTLTISNSYVDEPISLKISHRGADKMSEYIIGFANASSTDPDISSFIHTGYPGYLVKVGSGKYDFYVQKLSTYDVVTVMNLDISPYMIERMAIDWQTDQVSSLPAGYVTSSLKKVQSENKLLWAGGYHMSASHTVTLNEAISAQPNGIVLVFSKYEDASKDYDFNSFFISKQEVALREGRGHTFVMATSNLGSMATKYLYISDTRITGNNHNKETGTAASGISYINTNFVLRYVIGV